MGYRDGLEPELFQGKGLPWVLENIRPLFQKIILSYDDHLPLDPIADIILIFQREGHAHPIIRMFQDLYDHLREGRPWPHQLASLEILKDYLIDHDYFKEYQFLVGLCLANGPEAADRDATLIHQFVYLTEDPQRMAAFPSEVISLLESYYKIIHDPASAIPSPCDSKKDRDENEEFEFLGKESAAFFNSLENILKGPSQEFSDYLSDLTMINDWVGDHPLPKDCALTKSFFLLVKRILFKKFSPSGETLPLWAQTFPQITWTVWNINPFHYFPKERLFKEIPGHPFYPNADLWLSYLLDVPSQTLDSLPFGDHLQAKLLILKLYRHKAQLPGGAVHRGYVEKWFTQFGHIMEFLRQDHSKEGPQKEALAKIELRMIRQYPRTIFQTESFTSHYSQTKHYWTRVPADGLLNLGLYIGAFKLKDRKTLSQLKKHFQKIRGWEGSFPPAYVRVLHHLDHQKSHHSIIKEAFFDRLSGEQKAKTLEEMAGHLFLLPLEVSRLTKSFLTVFYQVYLEGSQKIEAGPAYHFHHALAQFLLKKGHGNLSPAAVKDALQRASLCVQKSANREIKELTQKFILHLFQLFTSTHAYPPVFLLNFMEGLNVETLVGIQGKILKGLRNYFQLYLENLGHLENFENEGPHKDFLCMFSRLLSILPPSCPLHFPINEMKGSLTFALMHREVYKVNFRENVQMELWG